MRDDLYHTLRGRSPASSKLRLYLDIDLPPDWSNDVEHKALLPSRHCNDITHLRLAGPKRFDRVARYKAMQALWAKDAFLKSGAGGAGGSGGLIGIKLVNHPIAVPCT